MIDREELKNLFGCKHCGLPHAKPCCYYKEQPEKYDCCVNKEHMDRESLISKLQSLEKDEL